MSRAEIVAAYAAYRATRRFAAAPAAALAARVQALRFDALLHDISLQVIDRPTYRVSLVAQLHERIRSGTYRAPADAIVEQLLGRLVAAELPS